MLRINFDNPIIHQDMMELDSRLPEMKNMFGKSIYISGASGMIASYLVGYLIWLNETQNAGVNIYAGIRDSEKARQRFGNYLDQSWFHLISSDVLTPLPEELRLDYIVHAASLASPQYYGTWPVETMLPNIVGTWLLLEHSRRYPVKGFLFFSSGSVYGSIKKPDHISVGLNSSGLDSSGLITSIKESDVGTFDFLAKGNVYGESKRCGEALSRSYFNEYSVPVRIARIHHTYGPTVDIDKDTRVFAEFSNDIIHCRDIQMKSTGETYRAFCYITDTITALLKIMFVGTAGEAYNIGNPDEYIRIIDLAQTLVNIFAADKNISIVQGKRNNNGYTASSEIRTAPVDVNKLKNLEWNHIIPINEGFSRMINAIEFDLKSKLEN